jgi:hypothetical protein
LRENARNRFCPILFGQADTLRGNYGL